MNPLLKDVEKRLRAASAKLRNWSIDAHAEGIKKANGAHEAFYEQWFEFKDLADALDSQVAWLIANASITMDAKAEEALRVAECRRRPRPAARVVDATFEEAEPVASKSPKARRARRMASSQPRALNAPLFTPGQLNPAAPILLLLPPRSERE